jgi:formylglycine-generating enzyme required for sulfatase activity
MGSPDTELGRAPDEPRHTVTLTRPYYIGLYEITQAQWRHVTGSNPSYAAGDTRPAEGMSYDDIRGPDAGARWPENAAVDPTSFLGKLRAKTHLPLDLPTEAQWEHAARAGATTALNNGQNLTTTPRADAGLDALGRYILNQTDAQGGTTAGHTAAGSYLPNAHGLHDTHGNTREYCLDWYAPYDTAAPATDPAGPPAGLKRVTRGGGWDDTAPAARSAARSALEPYNDTPATGLRLAMTIAPATLTLTPAAPQTVGTAPGALVYNVTTLSATNATALPGSATIAAGATRWARIAAITNDAAGGAITVEYDANLPGGAARAATLTVTATGVDDAITVTIEQTANPGPNGGGGGGSGNGGGAPTLPGLIALLALPLIRRALKNRR